MTSSPPPAPRPAFIDRFPGPTFMDDLPDCTLASRSPSPSLSPTVLTPTSPAYPPGLHDSLLAHAPLTHVLVGLGFDDAAFAPDSAEETASSGESSFDTPGAPRVPPLYRFHNANFCEGAYSTPRTGMRVSRTVLAGLWSSSSSSPTPFTDEETQPPVFDEDMSDTRVATPTHGKRRCVGLGIRGVALPEPEAVTEEFDQAYSDLFADADEPYRSSTPPRASSTTPPPFAPSDSFARTRAASEPFARPLAFAALPLLGHFASTPPRAPRLPDLPVFEGTSSGSECSEAEASFEADDEGAEYDDEEQDAYAGDEQDVYGEVYGEYEEATRSFSAPPETPPVLALGFGRAVMHGLGWPFELQSPQTAPRHEQEGGKEFEGLGKERAGEVSFDAPARVGLGIVEKGPVNVYDGVFQVGPAPRARMGSVSGVGRGVGMGRMRMSM